MRLLFDFFPILVFFIAYKLFGIFVATAMTMAASFLQVMIYWLKHRKFESLHIITLIMVLVMGGTTLWLHNDLYIKWKPTAIYWIFALTFLFSHFGKQPLIKHLLSSQVQLPSKVWHWLNLSWAIFFTLMGFANIYVLSHFSTDIWVDFKLFGSLGLTLLFIILQAFYLSKYIPNSNKHIKKYENPDDK